MVPVALQHHTQVTELSVGKCTLLRVSCPPYQRNIASAGRLYDSAWQSVETSSPTGVAVPKSMWENRARYSPGVSLQVIELHRK